MSFEINGSTKREIDERNQNKLFLYIYKKDQDAMKITARLTWIGSGYFRGSRSGTMLPKSKFPSSMSAISLLFKRPADRKI